MILSPCSLFGPENGSGIKLEATRRQWGHKPLDDGLDYRHGTSGPAVGWKDGSDAIFVGNVASTITIPVGVNVTANSITFTGTGDTVTGGSLTLAISTVTVGADATIDSGIAGSVGLYKAGSGKLTISSANTLTGNVRISDGVLRLNNPDALREATSLGHLPLRLSEADGEPFAAA